VGSKSWKCSTKRILKILHFKAVTKNATYWKGDYGKWKPSPGLIYPLLGRLLDEGLIEETEDGKYQITDEGKTISKDLEVFNKNMKEQIDTVMKMANVGKFMAMDVLERVTILGNLLSSNVTNMTNHEIEKYTKFLELELKKIKEKDSKK